jgi:TRAP-type mannitol/chloroaromatic compound transport system permease small subunit
LILFFAYSSQYAFEAWSRNEVAMDTAWAPYLGPVRTAMPLGVLFLLIQGVSELLKSAYAARRGKWPL